MDKIELGNFIAESRRSLDMTQQTLAEKLHVTGAAVSKWERGLSYPDLTLLRPLADALEVSVSQLMSCGGETSAMKQEDTMESVIQIAETSHKKQLRKILICSVCVLLGIIILAGLLIGTLRHTQLSSLEESGYYRFYAKESRPDGLFVYADHYGKLIELKCPDKATYNAIQTNYYQMYLVAFTYNANTGKGTLKTFENSDVTYSTPMHMEGASVGVERLFDMGFVWMRYVEVYPDPERNGDYLYTLQFYYKGNGIGYHTFDDAPETVLLTVLDCRNAMGYDYDGDGFVEAVVHTKFTDRPYMVYDRIDGQIVSKFVDASVLSEECLKKIQLP